MKRTNYLAFFLMLVVNEAGAHGMDAKMALFILTYLYWPVIVSLPFFIVGLYKMIRRTRGAYVVFAISIAVLCIQVPWHYATRHILGE